MTAQHTPGPWEYHERLSSSENHRGFAISAPTHKPSSRRIMVGEAVPMTSDGSEGAANARLIAAAPLMLEALQALTALPPSALLTVLKEAQRDVDEIVDQARAAIRAATGEDA